MGKIHIIALFIFVLHVFLSMEIDVYVDQDIKVNGMEFYDVMYSSAICV